jgi:hypothetical protein
VPTLAIAWIPAALALMLGAMLDRIDVGVWATERGAAKLLATEGGGCCTLAGTGVGPPSGIGEITGPRKFNITGEAK